MKLKRQPGDFRVEELPQVDAGPAGRFTFYRLTKSGLGTLEVIEAIARRWNLPRSCISYGGLKDRHAQTVQYLTIFDGPARSMRQEHFTLEPLGKLRHPYGPRDFRGNRFVVVMRSLTADAVASAERELAQLPDDGLPNYFDDQRFGSVRTGGQFIAEAWLAGDHERALRLAIAEPNPSDRPDTKAEKAIVREHWGRWAEAKEKLGRSHARSIVTYLVDHPDDFRGAFARLRRDLRSLYFSAYQSHLWNLLLARLIERATRPEQRVLVEFKTAPLPIHRGLDEAQASELAEWQLPLPSARNRLPEGPERELALGLMGELGLAWESLRVKHLKDVFLSKGTRSALFFPMRLSHRVDDDELYRGRKKIELSFELPKGAYATLLVKRVTTAGGASEMLDDDEGGDDEGS